MLLRKKTEPKKQMRADKLFNFRPFFFFAVFFCLGIFFAYLHTFHGVSAWWSFLLLPFAAASFFFCESKARFKKTACAIALLALCFGLGYASFARRVENFADCRRYDGVEYVVGRVAEKREYEGYTRLVLDELYIGENAEKGKLNAYLPTSFCENARLSDELLLRGYVRTDVEYFDKYGFRASDIGEGVRFQLSSVELCTVTGHRFDIFTAVRERIENVVYAGMDETPAAVTMAVLTGDTAGIEEGLLENVRWGGIAHIFAVSGLHMGALYAFCLLLVQKTPLKRLPKIFRFFLLTAILIFYAGVCGFSASVVRALVLCLIGYAFKLIGVPTDLLESLGVGGILILLLNPTALFEVGFQLSFLACLGIAFLRRGIGQVCDEVCEKTVLFFAGKRREQVIAERERKKELPPSIAERTRRWCVSFLSVSLSAQIFTAPLLLKTFGYLSGWSLLLNFLFVPMIGGLFSALLAFVAVACVLPIAASPVILYLPSVVWSTALLVFETADFSTFALTGIALPSVSLLLYYLAFTFASDKWNVSKTFKRIAFSTLILAFGVAVSATNLF